MVLPLCCGLNRLSMIDEGNSLLKHIGGPPAQMFAVEKGNL